MRVEYLRHLTINEPQGIEHFCWACCLGNSSIWAFLITQNVSCII